MAKATAKKSELILPGDADFSLMGALRTNDKSGSFTRSQSMVSYSTGLAPYDFANGFIMEARNLKNEVISRYPSVGHVAGSLVTYYGRPGTAKTTAAIQQAAHIVRPFKHGFVQHYDLEGATSYNRVRNVTGYSMEELANKYILKQENSYIEDIYDAIVKICEMKEAYKDHIMYKTGLLNEFGEEIMMFPPTVIIIDSIPVLASKESVKDEDKIEGQTYANRVARALSQFYSRVTPRAKQYNITIISINHLKQKIEMGMQKTQAQVNYMKDGETMPGGWAAIYYANTLVKFVATGGKFNMEENGFSGFNVRLEMIKSRTNTAGRICNMVYDQVTGFNNALSLFEIAKEFGLIGGRNPGTYFLGHEHAKFDSRRLKEFMNDEKIREALFGTTIPILERTLPKIDDVNFEAKISESDLLNKIMNSLEPDEEFMISKEKTNSAA